MKNKKIIIIGVVILVIGFVSFILKGWWECDGSTKWFDETVKVCKPKIEELKKMSADEERKIKEKLVMIKKLKKEIDDYKKKQGEYKKKADEYRGYIEEKAESYRWELVKLGFHKPK